MRSEHENGMRITTVNYHCDVDVRDPETLLARYSKLVDWAEALARRGAQVSVVQQFSHDAELTRGGITYRFVKNGGPILPASPHTIHPITPNEVTAAVSACWPDVVHVHSLRFARQAAEIARTLPHVPVLVQDHADCPPRSPLKRFAMRGSLGAVAAVSFSAPELALPWIRAGVISRSKPMLSLIEGSSRFKLRHRSSARAETGLSGSPLCIWVGRLNDNKDPLTVLRGFEAALTTLPHARLVMAYGTDDLFAEIQRWLRDRPETASRISLIGRVPHPDLEALYNSADLFLLGSRHESCGFAVIEALACGVVPVVTDIPSFRRLLSVEGSGIRLEERAPAGNDPIGGLWKPGNDVALATTLARCWRQWTPETPRNIRSHFETHWSIEAMGREALAAYSSLVMRAPVRAGTPMRSVA